MDFVAPPWLEVSLMGASNKTWLVFAVILLLIIILSYAINTVLLLSIGGVYRVFVAPGVIIHELSHALACMMTGAKINSIQVFKKEGGEVRHTSPKIPIIGQILISLSPFFVGFLLIYYLSRFVGFYSLDAVSLANPMSEIFTTLWQSIISINYSSLITWLALYLIISIAVTMIPSTRDLMNVFLSALALVAGIYILIKYLGVRIDPSMFFGPKLLAILATTVFVLIAALILSIILAMVIKMFIRR